VRLSVFIDILSTQKGAKSARNVSVLQNILKMHLWPGLCPDPAGELIALPQTIAGFGEGRGRGKEGEEERRGKGGEGKGKGKGG